MYNLNDVKLNREIKKFREILIEAENKKRDSKAFRIILTIGITIILSTYFLIR